VRNCETNPKPVPAKQSLSGRARKKAVFYAEAQRLFVEEGCSTKEIAEKIPVGRTIAARWCAEGGWLQMRKEFVQSTAGAAVEAKRLLRHLLKTMGDLRQGGEEIPDSLVARMAKLASVVEKLEDSTDPRHSFISVMTRFAEWVAENYREDVEFRFRVSVAVQGWTKFLNETRRRA
jgi:hypothetical protein